MTLGKREKLAVSLGVGFVAIFLFVQFALFPFLDQRQAMKRGIEVKRAGLNEIRMLKAEYESYKKRAEGVKGRLQRREKGFTLFSFLEQAAGRAKVKDRIKYMKPSDSQTTAGVKESMVEMKLENINLRQLVDYLYEVESPEHLVSIKRLSLKDNQGAHGYLDAVVQVVTIADG